MSQLVSTGLLVLTTTVTNVVTAADAESLFKITTKRDNDRVEVKVDKNTAIFSVQSPFGISHAIITRKNEKWPDGVLLRLHLKGLENFRVTNDNMKIEGAVSIQAGKPLVRLWKDGMERSPLDSKSPFWIGVRILSGDGKPAQEIPLDGGYFEMQLPPAFFEANPTSITVHWIDFYRN